MTEPFNLDLSQFENEINTHKANQYLIQGLAHHNANKAINDKYTNDILNRTLTESESETEYNNGLNERDLLNRHNSIENSNHASFQQKAVATKEHGRWTLYEHVLFLEGLMKYGNEWKLVQGYIQTRTATQARSHAQKFFIKLRKELLQIKNIDQIKSKICKIFAEKLGDKFKPVSIESFLNMMIRLIFTSERNMMLEKEKIEESRNTDLSKIQKNEKEMNYLHFKNSINSDIKYYEYNDTCTFDKPKIFIISKDCSRKQNINAISSAQEGLRKEFDTKIYNNTIQSLANSFQSSSINFVTINMVNNSQNNYINQAFAQTHRDTEIIMNNRNSNQKIKENKSANPFDLQFEELIEKNQKQSSNVMGFQSQDDKFNDDIIALLNLWNNK